MEHVEAPMSTFKESRPSKKFLNYMALLNCLINPKATNFEEATNQQVWRDAIVKDNV
jgi:hypothetical protein